MNELTKWSNLSRLAGGKMTRLTIAAPFVAFIILHNEPLQPFLDLAESTQANSVFQSLAPASELGSTRTSDGFFWMTASSRIPGIVGLIQLATPL